MFMNIIAHPCHLTERQLKLNFVAFTICRDPSATDTVLVTGPVLPCTERTRSRPLFAI